MDGTEAHTTNINKISHQYLNTKFASPHRLIALDTIYETLKHTVNDNVLSKNYIQRTLKHRKWEKHNNTENKYTKSAHCRTSEVQQIESPN